MDQPEPSRPTDSKSPPSYSLGWKLLSSVTILPCNKISSWISNSPYIPHVDQLGMRRSNITLLVQLLQPYNIKLLILHLSVSLILLGCLASNIKYLLFKIRLYYGDIPAALKAPWLLLLVACELFYFFSTVFSAIDFFLPPPIFISTPELPSDKEVEPQCLSSYNDDILPTLCLMTSMETCPSVHIMIPCCKEPTEVPQESILAALAVDYPKECFKVLVLDDGADDDLKVFCDTIQVESGTDQLVYLRRTKIPGVPHNFKCGNMNFGLQHSNAEYVVMMDADMILHPSFLIRVLPHIVSTPDVSFVQVPQSFYNLPLGDPLNDACVFAYDRSMVHRNTLRCPPCVGTGAIFRRKHLDEIGGFQPQSITEDTMTSYMLFNQGYKSVYVNEKLQVGITPWTFEGFIKQRQRWGKGAIQQLVSSWRNMLGNGSKLSIIQRCFYFWHTGYYYMSILNVIVVLILWSGLAMRLNFVIGDEADNQTLMSYLAIYVLSWKLFWYVLWVKVSQPVQSRNRDDSQFWWMTPFFFHLVVQAAFDFKGTFTFVPTSNIDRMSVATMQSPLRRKLNSLKLVQVHIGFIIICIATVLVRAYQTITGKLGFEEGRCEGLTVVGLSVFLLTVCAHMSVPVLHILMPTGFPPEYRKSLLHYNSQGVPIFEPDKIGTKWHPSVIFFEFLSWLNIIFWIVIYLSAGYISNAFTRFCPTSSNSH
ncbi:hypothetical protein L7F22_067500 [Adiantum nelumboides]|nr:hypothetical protein [Adiantum nelumboides]